MGEKQYLLVHGGLGGFTPEKRIEEYSLHGSVYGPDQIIRRNTLRIRIW